MWRERAIKLNRWGVPNGRRNERQNDQIRLYNLKGLRGRCAPKHRNSRRETAGWDRVDRQEVFVLCWKAGPSPNVGSAKARAGSLNTPGPFNFPISRAPACAAESPKLSLPGAAPGRLANGVVADKQCTCPASRLMWERYPPTPPAFACCVATGEGCRAEAKRRRAITQVR